VSALADASSSGAVISDIGHPEHSVCNRILALLARDDLDRLLRQGERITFVLGQSIQKAGDRIRHVIFPDVGWISQVVMVAGSEGAEVGLIGREGMAGLPILLGDDRSMSEWIVQGVGHGFRLRAAMFTRLLDDMPTLRRLLLRYTLAFQIQVAQTAACNGQHHVEQRLARWLLMAHDRADNDSFGMTQEFLSLMLGVRRAGIAQAAKRLQQAGLIGYRRGVMTVNDRAGLEASTCGCYQIVRNEFDRLLAPT